MSDIVNVRLKFQFLGEDGETFANERELEISRRDWSTFTQILPTDSSVRRDMLEALAGRHSQVIVVPWGERFDFQNTARARDFRFTVGMGELSERALPDS